MLLANAAWAAPSTGRCRRNVDAGCPATELPLFQSVLGLIGRGVKPPPQFGHTFSSTCSTHSRQNVHSNEQIIASGAAGGRSVAQFSQIGRSSRAIPPFSPTAERLEVVGDSLGAKVEAAHPISIPSNRVGRGNGRRVADIAPKDPSLKDDAAGTAQLVHCAGADAGAAVDHVGLTGDPRRQI